MRRYSEDTPSQIGRLLRRRKPAGARKTVWDLRSYICGGYDPDWMVGDALRIVQLDPSIVIRDTMHETFPMQHGKYHENFTLRKILLTFLGLIIIGIMTGFLVFTPSVLLGELAADGDPTISLHYTSADDWTITASLSAHIKLENQSLLPMQIPTCAAHVIEACYGGGGSDNTRRRDGKAPSSPPTMRVLQDKKIPIHHREFDWGTSGRTKGPISGTGQAAEVVPVSRPLPAPIAVAIEEIPSGSEESKQTPEWHANSSALGPDNFYGMFELRTPDNLERASLPICFATPLLLTPVYLMQRASTALQLDCMVQLAGGSRPEPVPPPLSCEGVPNIMESSTAAIKEFSRSKVYQAEGGGRVKTTISEPPGAAETRIEDLVEACAKYGHVWLQFQLLQGWVWQLGTGGTMLTQQTTAPVAVPCVVL